MLQFNDNPPLSLYIHLPWCVKKCPYCDFNSHAIEADSVSEQAYVEALIRDLEFDLPKIWGRRIGSIFIGGGTPSLFSGSAIKQLLSAIHARLNFNPQIEITLEANPGTVDSDHFRAYRDAGVNRLSIGVQSFSDQHLKALGRIHSSSEVMAAIDTARAAGFENINLDLMFGLPGQTHEQAIADLQQAINSCPTHISWYQLTIEPNTVFYSQPPALPKDDLIWEMQLSGQQILQSQGYQQYEVSAYATAEHQCRHNLNYWQFGDYLGLGAGAHGKLTHVNEQQISRYARHRIPASYMQYAGKDSAIAETRVLQRKEIPLEFMLNTLRLTNGFDPGLFLQRCGMPINIIQRELEQAVQQEMIEWEMDYIKPTGKGQRYLNSLLELFLPE